MTNGDGNKVTWIKFVAPVFAIGILVGAAFVSHYRLGVIEACVNSNKEGIEVRVAEHNSNVQQIALMGKDIEVIHCDIGEIKTSQTCMGNDINDIKIMLIKMDSKKLH